jgi:hypothetical protein
MHKNTYLMASLLLVSLIFPSQSQAITWPYCCCNEKQCIAGDHQTCCSTSEHPEAWPYGIVCTGVEMSGNLGTDPNPCHN